jgi:hypothetical protein
MPDEKGAVVMEDPQRSGQPPRPEFSTGAKAANWPLWTIVAQ